MIEHTRIKASLKQLSTTSEYYSNNDTILPDMRKERPESENYKWLNFSNTGNIVEPTHEPKLTHDRNNYTK